MKLTFCGLHNELFGLSWSQPELSPEVMSKGQEELNEPRVNLMGFRRNDQLE